MDCTVMDEACQFSYGTKMVEVWVWDSDESLRMKDDGTMDLDYLEHDCYIG
jgi:hypothetical protein